MEEPLISIIVPVYNVEKTLKACIDSIINQSYKNIEIILIDDGSADSSGAICDEYKSKDSRVVVVHNNNEGVAAARNTALKLYKGEFITFIDSDDIAHKDLIKVLYDNLINNNADISICSYKSFFGEIDTDTQYINDTTIFSNEQAIYELNVNNRFTLALWSKLYKRELFEGEEFPLLESSSDNFIGYRVLFKSNKIVYSNDKLYFYYERPESITHRKTFINMNVLYEGKKIIKYIQEKLPSQYYTTIYKYMITTLGLYNKMLNNKCIDEDKVKEIEVAIFEWYNILNGNYEIPKFKKFQIKLFLKSKSLYSTFHKIFKVFKKV